MELELLCKNACEAKKVLGGLSTGCKNDILLKTADALCLNAGEIIEANSIDIENGIKNGMSEALIDRLKLTTARIEDMALGLKKVADLPDPIGEVTEIGKSVV